MTKGFASRIVEQAEEEYGFYRHQMNKILGMATLVFLVLCLITMIVFPTLDSITSWMSAIALVIITSIPAFAIVYVLIGWYRNTLK